MPTLTIVALALRLADHVKDQYGSRGNIGASETAKHVETA
jgi:hypothetical protein